MEETVILVDRADREIGEAPKIQAHVAGSLHRAFSVFIVDDAGRILLQRRAEGKYHSAGLWTNACCGHPRPGEKTHAAAERRLSEEMGIDTDLINTYSFIYEAAVGNDLIEHELDHVFVGRYSEDPRPNPHEVQEWKWITRKELSEWMVRDPNAFTAWFRQALQIATTL